MFVSVEPTANLVNRLSVRCPGNSSKIVGKAARLLGPRLKTIRLEVLVGSLKIG